MTAWTDFVKSFAKEHNISYGCALSDPDCSAGYKAKYGVKKPLGKKKERESMGAEDINRVILLPKKTPERKEKISALKSSLKQKQNKKILQNQLVETMGMMAEDIKQGTEGSPTTPPFSVSSFSKRTINRIPIQDIAGNFVPIVGNTAKKSKGGRKKGSKNKPKGAVPTNISMVIEEVAQPKGRGRPKKYATAEEARKAKIANTIASAKRRKEKKGGAIIDRVKKGAKEIFKRTNPVEYALLSGASNIAQNPTAIIYGRNDFPPKVRQIISKYGNKNIVGVTLGRTPLGAPLMTALQLASGNTFQQRLDNTPYDKLFHLFMCIELAGGSKIMMEKNEVINAVLGCKLPKETETRHISSSDIPTGLTLEQSLNNTKEGMGDMFFTYSARENNCQDFILAFLRANKIGNETDKSWVKQETKVLFEGNERLRKIANTLTGIAASFDVIKEGAGLDSDSDSDSSSVSSSSSSSSSSSGSSGISMEGFGIIDFEDMKWGSFSKQLEAYNSQHKKKLDLHSFAMMILANPKKFKKTTIKRARFYVNVILKKGKGFFDDVVSGLNKINPVMWGIKNKPEVGIKLGKITNNNLLPAVVEIGKPVYDATAIATATTLTGNPILGKVVADQFWEKFGKPYDPRSRQDNAALKKISEEVGKTSGSKANTIIKGKGFSEKKSLSNTKKSNSKVKGMANKWITYVKEYAKKHNLKYNDALKDPKLKEGYKSGKGMPDDKFFQTPVLDHSQSKPVRPRKSIKEGMGIPTSQDEYIAELYNQANLGANGRVNLN